MSWAKAQTEYSLLQTLREHWAREATSPTEGMLGSGPTTDLACLLPYLGSVVPAQSKGVAPGDL